MSNQPDLDYYNRLLHLVEKAEDLNLKEHDYNISSFGNWYIDYEKDKVVYRIRWIGKTRNLVHQYETDEVWLNQNIYKDISTLTDHDLPLPDKYLEDVLAV